MSLFAHLPPPSAADLDEIQSGSDEELEEKLSEPVPAAHKRPRETAAEQLSNPAQLLKKPKPEAANQSQAAFVGDVQQTTAALQKIASHIGKPDKFVKASGLLRRLIDSGALQKSHRVDLFKVVKAAFADTSASAEPLLRKEYVRLMNAIDHIELFGRSEKAQLEVYRIWACLRAEMHTDDSFVFNKAIGKLKDLIADLPPVTDDDEAALQTALTGEPEPASEDTEPEHPAPDCAKEEADPFGLDTLFKPEKAATKKLPSHIWGPKQCICMRRQALLDCVESAKGYHKLAWASTSVELLIDHVQKHMDSFCLAQRPQIDQFLQFVKHERMLRKQGRVSTKELKRDKTSFEIAQAAWSKVHVSTRGKVGGGGDHKSENWLG